MANSLKDVLTDEELAFAEAHKVGFCKKPKDFDAMMPFSVSLWGTKFIAPIKVDTRWHCTKTEDQGSKPWCAAYAAAQWAEAIRWQIKDYPEDLDPTWIYSYAKSVDGDPHGDGTTLTAVLEALLYKKVFSPSVCDVKVLRPNIEDIKYAIHKFGLVLGGFNITSEWYMLNPNKTFVCNPKNEDFQGGHAVLICGYDENGLYFQNSWGERWGDSGFGGISWDCVKAQLMYGSVLTNCLNGLS